MVISVNVRQLGSRRDRIAGLPFRLARAPQTVEELITESVRSCVAAFNARLAAAPCPLAEGDVEAMAKLGKITFGLAQGDEEADGQAKGRADEQVAIACALQAYEDGLFRVFVGSEPCGALGEALALAEGDSVTFIRLTMLAGGLW